ncbi:MAG: SGNH/GDSL hydrolase family protein [Candidatus Bathyarchaeota archaeon]|jgi:lysophospholipase L1-like esterase
MAETSTLIFAALGDSLTRGFMPYNPHLPLAFSVPYTSYLDNMVVTELSKRGWDNVEVSFVNLGVNGDTTRGMLRRFSHQVTPLEPDYIIVWGGINDLYGSIKPERVMGSLEGIYGRAAELGAEPVACTLTSVLGFDPLITTIRGLNAMIREHCSQKEIAVVDLFGATSDEEGRLREEYSSDGVHLSVEGYSEVASTVYQEAVEPILNRIRA